MVSSTLKGLLHRMQNSATLHSTDTSFFVPPKILGVPYLTVESEEEQHEEEEKRPELRDHESGQGLRVRHERQALS